MKILYLIFFTIAFTVGCTQKNLDTRIILWQDAKYGMSIDEIKTLYPSIEIISNNYVSDSIFLYQFDGVVVQKEDFYVRFLFSDQILVGVILCPKNNFAFERADNLVYLLKEELTQKYGNPVNENNEFIQHIGSFIQTSWNVQNLVITLDFIRPSFTFDPAVIEIMYTSGTIEIEDNL